METYLINEDWNKFFEFAQTQLKRFDENDFCFKHNKDKIYIRAVNPLIITVIGTRFKLTPGVKTPGFLNKDQAWEYSGNEKLFPIEFL